MTPTTLLPRFKAQMTVDRGGMRCDICGKRVGCELHHIVSKGRTVGNPAARKASEHPHLFSLLCADCHREQDSHNPETATQLLAFNCKLYGYEEVKATFDAVNDLLHRPVNIQFPEAG